MKKRVLGGVGRAWRRGRGEQRKGSHSRASYAEARHVQEHGLLGGVRHPAGLESARKFPETSDGRLERKLRRGAIGTR